MTDVRALLLVFAAVIIWAILGAVGVVPQFPYL